MNCWRGRCKEKETLQQARTEGKLSLGERKEADGKEREEEGGGGKKS